MKRFNNILYLVEEGEGQLARSIDRVVALARDNQARLTVLSVLEKPRLGFYGEVLLRDEYEGRIRQKELDRLKKAVASHAETFEIQLDVKYGTAFIVAIQDILRNGRDLVVKTVGHGGPHAFLFGGTDQHLLRKSPCPVWLMHAEEHLKCRKVMAAIDFDPWQEEEEPDELNKLILELASSLALTDLADLHVAHAWQPVSERVVRVFGSDLPDQDVAKSIDREYRAHLDRTQDLVAHLRDSVGKEGYKYLSPRVHVRRGDARNVIPTLAEELEIDLVVMGTVSRTGIPGFLIGNTAEVILNNLDCAVLAVKPSGFVSPVVLGPVHTTRDAALLPQNVAGKARGERFSGSK